ncbi:hypothetical protein F4779DRAFT_305508 [Xylariaceae sp. FL0662B]|nr:hypothetical protein F4779DRAFT_305508 [Xylariaceae sp. FL0662B]
MQFFYIFTLAAGLVATSAAQDIPQGWYQYSRNPPAVGKHSDAAVDCPADWPTNCGVKDSVQVCGLHQCAS